MPDVLAPSVSRTTISGANDPVRGAGAPFGSGDAAVSDGATFRSIWAMASTDLRIAAPIVVPRPVVSESIALNSSSR
jgi:hypothetical protein